MENLTYPLRCRNIKVENIIGACNVLAMVGPKNAIIAQQSNDVDSMLGQLVAKGNLDQMLSHNESNFCSNFKNQPRGIEVRYKNNSKYVVVCNNLCGYKLYINKNSIYSRVYPHDTFIENIVNNATASFQIPYSFFDWKSIYNIFIDTIKKEYDSDHIILIRTNAMQWYLSGENIEKIEGQPRDFRNQVEMMDNLFVERTRCHCIDVMYSSVPTDNSKCAWPYSSKTESFYTALEYALDDIINKKSDAYKTTVKGYCSPLIKKINNRLSGDILEKYADEITTLEKKYIEQLSDIDSTSDFINNLNQLKMFIECEQRYSLGDYVTDIIDGNCTDSNIQLIELATEYLKLGLEEILSIFKLYKNSSDKTKYKNIVRNICHNKDCYPINYTNEFIKRNLNKLANYEYIESELLAAELDKHYIKLDNDCLIVLDASADEPISFIDTQVKRSVSYLGIINNDYVCDISEANALCSDLAFYIARARYGKGNYPITIHFDSIDKFALSLTYIDYCDLLDNEYFVINCQKPLKKFGLRKFQTRTDLSFMFDKRNMICYFRAGLADQITYYTTYKWIEKETGRKAYFDDIFVERTASQNRSEVHKIVGDNIENRLFSRIFSRKLIARLNAKVNADILYQNGLTELCGISETNYLYEHFKNCPRVFIPEKCSDAIGRAANIGIPYYACFTRPIQLIEHSYFKLSDYIKFPPFEENDPNIEIVEQMKTSDAVVVHIRRGDFVTLGREVDNGFYVESFEKLKTVPDYPNKHFFIFSDDILWCRENIDNLGLSIFPEAKITFVDHNKEENSFRDLQLFSLAKIIIGGPSGFINIGMLLADNCEVQMLSDTIALAQIEKFVRKSKYDIGAYSKDYSKGAKNTTKKEIEQSISNSNPPSPSESSCITQFASGESVEWLNYWFDYGNQSREDRILLIGDSVSREYRSSLGKLIGKPIDFFATSSSINDELFWKELDMFFSIKEYRQKKVHIMIGCHEIEVRGAKREVSIPQFEKNYDRLITIVKQHISDITIATYSYFADAKDITKIDEKANEQIMKINEAIIRIANKHKLPINDMFALTYGNQIVYKHRDAVHYQPEVQTLLAKQVAKAMKLK